jgi:hypothetical protein
VDDGAFDRLTRSLGRASGRRGALALVAGVAALLLPRQAAADYDRPCRRNGGRCRRYADCCSLTCAGGRCTGSRIGGPCLTSQGCSLGYCHLISSYRGSCRCIMRNRRCSDGRICCSGRCSMTGRCECSAAGQACEMSMHCCGTNLCVDGRCVPPGV